MSTFPNPELDAATDGLAEKIRAIGTEVNPSTIGATIALCMPLHAGASDAGLKISRDLIYGPAERHRLDVFATDGAGRRPVMLFVHGGGFVGGNKSNPGSPFYDNVGRWAARNGMLGVTMTYRLAPEHRWPAGSEDVGQAVRWLRQNVGAHGGDPERIFVMGQSAGAVHVAGYVALEHSGVAVGGAADSAEGVRGVAAAGAASGGWRPAGAVLISGLYDTRTMERNPLFAAYFGADGANVAFLDALARTPVPLMVTLSELDPRDFQRQAVELNAAYVEQHQHWPRFIQLAGHNHLSTIFGLNAPGDRLGPQILAFTRSV